MNEKIEVNVNKYLVLKAEGENCSQQFELLLSMKDYLWEKEPIKFAFFCNDWMENRGCTVRLVASETLDWVRRGLLNLLLSLAVGKRGKAK
jgi:hypothetical protein